MVRRLGVQSRHVDHGEVRRVRRNTCGLGDLEKHVAGEQAVPCLLGDDADSQPVARIRAGIAVLNEELAPFDVAQKTLVQRVEVPSFNWAIDLAPPDAVGTRRLLDDELVVRRAACMLAGSTHQWTVD